MNTPNIEIIDFSEDLKPYIKQLNYEWLEKYFSIEESDVISLSNPKKEIIDKGGYIFFARMDNKIIATASLLKKTDSVFELAKMAVTQNIQGKGIGKLLVEHCISFSKKRQISKLILYSNTALYSALQLYKKYGFEEVKLEETFYKRANIKMELKL